MDNAKHIEDVEGKQSALEVYECPNCGFHIGVDATFVEQVMDAGGSIVLTCLSCQATCEVVKEADEDLLDYDDLEAFFDDLTDK